MHLNAFSPYIPTIFPYAQHMMVCTAGLVAATFHTLSDIITKWLWPEIVLYTGSTAWWWTQLGFWYWGWEKNLLWLHTYYIYIYVYIDIHIYTVYIFFFYTWKTEAKCNFCSLCRLLVNFSFHSMCASCFRLPGNWLVVMAVTGEILTRDWGGDKMEETTKHYPQDFDYYPQL